MKIRPVISELFCPDGSLVNSDDDMAALFNNYFSSVLQVKIPLLFLQLIHLVLLLLLILLILLPRLF